MNASLAIDVQEVTYRYGSRKLRRDRDACVQREAVMRPALQDVSFTVSSGEFFGLLGPNGGGKTTLFRLLCTLMPLQQGEVNILGLSLAKYPESIRKGIGITFQSPSLDLKLTVWENLTHQAHLYGLAGSMMRNRIDELLSRLGLQDRHNEIVQTLSGGLKRRIEIAKGLLHRPDLLLLDEPGTGLDPTARHDLWRMLQNLCGDDGTTILLTTHLMEEAERCDRLVILDQGKVVANGHPEELRASIGGDCLTLSGPAPEQLAKQIRKQFSVDVRRIGQQLRIEHENGRAFLNELLDTFATEITSIELGKPTLEDVFIARTGHQFRDDATAVNAEVISA